MVSNVREKVNNHQIGLAIFFGKPWNNRSEISVVKFSFFIDLSREKAFAQRAKGDEPNSELFQNRENLLFGFPPPERIFALKCRYGLDRMGPPYRIYPSFR